MEEYISKQEQERIDIYIQCCKNDFEKEEEEREIQAEREGKPFEARTFVPPSQATALAAIRAGWLSPLDKRFKEKFEREKRWKKNC